jgi:hypothetical protein
MWLVPFRSAMTRVPQNLHFRPVFCVAIVRPDGDFVGMSGATIPVLDFDATNGGTASRTRKPATHWAHSAPLDLMGAMTGRFLRIFRGLERLQRFLLTNGLAFLPEITVFSDSCSACF